MKTKPAEMLSKIKKTRSCGYPLLPLSRAIEAAKVLFGGFGDGPYSRENAAKGLGYSSFSGAPSGKIGSLVHFGLLARAEGMYSVAQAARTAFSYPEEGSRDAIVELAQNPVLYRKLISRFLNKPLPEKLASILCSDYGITGKAAPLAAQNFIETLEFAGLVREGNLILPDLAGIAAPEGGKMFFPKDNRGAVLETSIKIKLASGVEVAFPDYLAYRLSMGEFAGELKNLEKKTSGVE